MKIFQEPVCESSLTINIDAINKHEPVSGIYLINIGIVKDLRNKLSLPNKYNDEIYNHHYILLYAATDDIINSLKQLTNIYKYECKRLKLTMFKYIPYKNIGYSRTELFNLGSIKNYKISNTILITNDIGLIKVKKDYNRLSEIYKVPFDHYNKLNDIKY